MRKGQLIFCKIKPAHVWWGYHIHKRRLPVKWWCLGFSICSLEWVGWQPITWNWLEFWIRILDRVRTYSESPVTIKEEINDTKNMKRSQLKIRDKQQFVAIFKEAEVKTYPVVAVICSNPYLGLYTCISSICRYWKKKKKKTLYSLQNELRKLKLRLDYKKCKLRILTVY